MEQTALEFSGILWTIFDHILGLIFVTLTVHIVSKKQNNENYKFSHSVFVAIAFIACSLLIELTLPIKYVVFSIPVALLMGIILCKLICRIVWKKAIIMGVVLFIVTIVVGVIEAVLLGIIKTIS